MRDSEALKINGDLKSQLEVKRGLISFFNRKQRLIKDKHYRSAKKNKAHIGSILAKKRSDIVDSIINRSLESKGFKDIKGLSIVALGGYGRSELCPYSDVDLLFLHKKRSKSLAKEISEHLLYFLWDLKLEIGHSVRTIDECVELSFEDNDTTILTSLLDSRFISGDFELFEELEKTIYFQFLPHFSSKFIDKKIQERDSRMGKYGKYIYLLEPNVKEGEGGLRDIQTALWIAQAKYKIKSFDDLLKKGVINEKVYRVINKCYNFLLLVRSELHYLAGRKEDRLSFEFQEKVSRFFGYKDNELKGVERFMRLYYLRAHLANEQSKRVIEASIQKVRSNIRKRKTVYLENGFTIQNGQLSVTSRTAFKENNLNIIRAFEYSDIHDIEMSGFLALLIRENVVHIDRKTRKDPEFNKIFLRILRTGKEVFQTLYLMNELRFLAHYIPEFGEIVCMVQHDAYHVFTVDVHSIFMVQEIESLIKYKYIEQFPLITKTVESILNREVLYLACLLHDVGKGSGKGHSEKGAAISMRVARRMGLGEKETEQLEFLVRNHLVMSQVSQTRDLRDLGLIDRFAKLVKSSETLSLLYILTFADIRSVGPEVWSNWKDMLLRDLYIRTAKYLELGDYTERSINYRISQIIKNVKLLSKGKFTEKGIKKTLSGMPDSYFLGYSSYSIYNHIKLIRKAPHSPAVDILYHPKEEFDELTYWGFDTKGIFSNLCGVITACGLNIMGARIVTTVDNKILDVFFVNKLGKSIHDDSRAWQRVKKYLLKVSENKLDVEEFVEKYKTGAGYYQKETPKYPTKITFDNDTSEEYTILEVITHDRIALLYDITKTLTELGLNINYAKISTKVDQVVDAFYVKDLKGKKISNKKRLAIINNSLLEAISDKLVL